MATYTWIGGSADWNTPAGWFGGIIPGSADTASLALTGANYTVTVGLAEAINVNNLTVTAGNATLEVDGALAASGQINIGPGTIIAKGSLFATGITDGGLLAFVGSHVLSGAQINIGSATGGTLQVQDIDSNTPAILTLDAFTLVQQSDLSATITSTTTNGETIFNRGRINAQFGGGSMTIAPLNFINQGLINASNRESLTITGNWTNATGIVAVTSDATLTLGGTFNTPGLGTIIGANSINLTGTLDNTGATLAVGRGSPVGTINMQDTAVITGGTLTDVGGAAFTFTGNDIFNAVRYQGPLNISTPGGRLTVTNGLTVTQSVSSAPGVININGGRGSTLNFSNSQTIDNATINLEGADAFNEQVEINISGVSGSLLTLGPHLIVSSAELNTDAFIRSTNRQTQPSLLNRGTIIASASGATFNILMNGFINQGTISVSNGDTFSIQPGSGIFNNSGSVLVGSGSLLQILDTATTSPISNTGTITLQSGSMLELGGFYTLSSLGKINNQGAIIQIDGTLDGQTGTLTASPGSVVLLNTIRNTTIETNDAFIVRGANASLRTDIIHGAVNLTDNATKLTINEGVTFGGPLGSGAGTINVTGKGDTLAFGNVVSGGGVGQTFDNVTVNIGNASGSDTIAPTFGGGTLTIGANANIVSASTGARATISPGAGTGIVLKGRVSATGTSGLFTIAGVAGSTFVNNGIMSVGNGDTLSVTTALLPGTAFGVINIDRGGIAAFSAPVADNQALTFTAGAGTLKLLQPTSFAASISSFFLSDTINLVATPAKNAVWTAGAIGQAGTLTVTNAAGKTVASLAMLGDYSHASFTVVSDTAGGSDVTTTATCYAAGTRIRTTRGDVAVERLREGDMVVTISGGTQPIRWIGRRHVDFRRHPNPRRVLPIRVTANAFGNARPKRDLVLSPDHSVFVEDVLIPIRHLENGTTVTQLEVEAITYYHIELPWHDVVLAEGMPAESYLESGARDAFANGGAVMQLHPDFTPTPDRFAVLWETSGYAPLVVAGKTLDRVRCNLARQATMLSSARRPRPRTPLPHAGEVAELQRRG